MLFLRQFGTALSNNRFAIDAGRRGRLVLGYDCLLLGLRGARQATTEGLPWGPELVRLYSQAIDVYTKRFGVCLAADKGQGSKLHKPQG
jgi:hypothetical protein